VKRRAFLGSLVALLAAEASALVVGRERLKSLYLSSAWIQRTRTRLNSVDQRTGAGSLSPDLETRLWAVALVLLPSQVDPRGKSAVLEHFRWRAAESPGYRQAFIDAVELTDQETRRQFPTSTAFGGLPRGQANEVLRSLLDGIPPKPRLRHVPIDVVRFWLSPTYRERVGLRHHFVNEVLSAYYHSGAGWALVGYDTYPGVCGGLNSYSRPPLGASRPTASAVEASST